MRSLQMPHSQTESGLCLLSAHSALSRIQGEFILIALKRLKDAISEDREVGGIETSTGRCESLFLRFAGREAAGQFARKNHQQSRICKLLFSYNSSNWFELQKTPLKELGDKPTAEQILQHEKVKDFAETWYKYRNTVCSVLSRSGVRGAEKGEIFLRKFPHTSASNLSENSP